MAPSVDIVGENGGEEFRDGEDRVCVLVDGRVFVGRADDLDDDTAYASLRAECACSEALVNDEDTGLASVGRLLVPLMCVPNPTRRVFVSVSGTSIAGRPLARADAERVLVTGTRCISFVRAVDLVPSNELPSFVTDRSAGRTDDGTLGETPNLDRRAEVVRTAVLVTLLSLEALDAALPGSRSRAPIDPGSKLNWNSRWCRCDGVDDTARTPTPAYALGVALPSRPDEGRKLRRPSPEPRADELRRGSNDIVAADVTVPEKIATVVGTPALNNNSSILDRQTRLDRDFFAAKCQRTINSFGLAPQHTRAHPRTSTCIRASARASWRPPRASASRRQPV